jgi:spermidine/putrescine transport system substrate-binding protein
VGVLLVALVTLLVAGCGSSNSSSSSASSAPTKELHIYAWSGEVPASTVAAFEKATGIKTTVDTFDSNETMVSKLQSGATGYDLVEPSQYAVQELAQLKLIAPLDKSRLSNFKNLMPMFQNVIYDPGDKYSIPWIWGTTGLAYNDKYIKGPVTSWKALWDPAYKGHILMLDNMLAAYIAAFQINGYNFNSTVPSQIAKATQSLMQQKPLLMGYNATDFAQLLSDGQCWICEAWNSNITPVAATNKHIHYVLPSEGGSFWTDGFVLLKSAKNVDAAYQWLNFILEPKVAAAASNTQDFAVANGAAMPYIEASIRNNPTIYTPMSELKHATVFLNPTAQTALLENYWTKIRS